MRLRAGLLVLAIAAALVPVPATVVESLYSTRFFPVVQRVLTSLSNRAPHPLFDVLVVLVVGLWLLLTIRDFMAVRRVGWLRTLGGVASRTLLIAAASYLLFLVTWGFNYRRVVLVDKLQFDSALVSTGRAFEVANQVVDRVNALYEPAHQAGWRPLDEIDSELVGAFETAQRELGLTGRTVPGRPRHSVFDIYFVKAGVAGMTDPYFLETLAASDLLPFERTFVVAHEWSHLAGLGDEGDANFLGWLTCLRGNTSHQYSGWLFLYSEVLRALGQDQAREVAGRLGAGPRADLQAIRDRILQHVNAFVSGTGWRIYDRYLKANRVDRGYASYADVVRLVLGTEFGDNWSPRLRQ